MNISLDLALAKPADTNLASCRSGCISICQLHLDFGCNSAPTDSWLPLSQIGQFSLKLEANYRGQQLVCGSNNNKWQLDRLINTPSLVACQPAVLVALPTVA